MKKKCDNKQSSHKVCIYLKTPGIVFIAVGLVATSFTLLH